MNKTALITGVTGQDGSYLANFLLKKGYVVHGTSRTSNPDTWRHLELDVVDSIIIHVCNLTELSSVTKLIKDIKPTEIYHLAAQSSVAESFANPYETFYHNSLSTLTLLETIRMTNPSIKFFNASSSEIFDQFAPQPLSLTSPRLPTSPYGISKLSAHLLTEQYRNQYSLFAVNGVLFPHESPLRQPRSFIKSVIRQAVAYTRDEQNDIILGYIDTERDFGDAILYTEIMWRGMQISEPKDYIIATGQKTSLRSIADYIFAKLKIPAERITSSDTLPDTLPKTLYGDITITNEQLGKLPHFDLYATIDAMIEFEMTHANNTRIIVI